MVQRLLIRQHTSAYVSIRQHTSVRLAGKARAEHAAFVVVQRLLIRQHTSAYVSQRAEHAAFVVVQAQQVN